MKSLYSTQILIFLCIAAFLSDCVLSRGVRSEKKNATSEDSESKPHMIPPRKHLSRNKRPAIFIKERGSLNLTRSPTYYKKVTLFARVGLFLHVNANGTISGSFNQQSEFVKFELQSFGPSIVRIRSVKTGKFLAINSKGTLQTRKDATEDCLFYQNHEENLFVSFASFKYYMNEHYDMFLSVKRNGEVKQPFSTLPGQDSIQFITFNVDSWRPGGKMRFGGWPNELLSKCQSRFFLVNVSQLSWVSAQ